VALDGGADVGVLFVACGLVGTSIAAAAHRGDVIDAPWRPTPGTSGTLDFANAWLALCSFAPASGLASPATDAFPRWLA
jgi:hypothetical protein